MQYANAFYVDAKDGIPANIVPTRNGQALPSPQLTVSAIDLRPWPKSQPIIIGTMPDGVALPAGVTAVTQVAYNATLAELAALAASQAADLTAALFATLAAHRFDIETGGVSVSGTPIATDRDSQSQIQGAYQALSIPLVSSLNWKCADGSWVTMTSATMTPVAQAVASHVQACFAAEQQVGATITAGTLTASVQSAFDAALATITAAA